MFERFTEKVRRAIFFSRYEASQYGSPCIETEHLLLGLLRREDPFSREVLREKGAETAREQIEQQYPKPRSPVSTSVDLPLSDISKRVLAYGAEEAERLQSRPIRCSHLLLGLLREREGLAAKILEGLNVTAEAVRLIVAKNPAEETGEHGPHGPEYLLLQMSETPKSPIAEFLREHGITSEGIRKRFGIK